MAKKDTVADPAAPAAASLEGAPAPAPTPPAPAPSPPATTAPTPPDPAPPLPLPAATIAGNTAPPAPGAPRSSEEQAGDDAYAAAIHAGKTGEEAAELAMRAVRRARGIADVAVDAPSASTTARIVNRRDIPPPLVSAFANATDEELEAVEASFRRNMQVVEEARDPVAFIAALRSFASAIEELVKSPTASEPVADGYAEEKLDVPGEGIFIVRRNGWDADKKKFRDNFGKVELIAKTAVPGTGIMPGNNFAYEPEQAVRLVLLGIAVPRQQGGVRRTKGALRGE